MLRSLKSHLEGNLVAYLALFVALGGSSYAVTRLPANSVGAEQSGGTQSAHPRSRIPRYGPGISSVANFPPGPKGDRGVDRWPWGRRVIRDRG